MQIHLNVNTSLKGNQRDVAEEDAADAAHQRRRSGARRQLSEAGPAAGTGAARRDGPAGDLPDAAAAGGRTGPQSTEGDAQEHRPTVQDAAFAANVAPLGPDTQRAHRQER